MLVSMMPVARRAELSMPLSPLSAQRQMIAVIVSETAQGSMMMMRARPRPWKSSLRMSATGMEIRIVPATMETVQIRVRRQAPRKAGSATTARKLSRPAKPRSWPKRLTSLAAISVIWMRGQMMMKPARNRPGRIRR